MHPARVIAATRSQSACRKTCTPRFRWTKSTYTECCAIGTHRQTPAQIGITSRAMATPQMFPGSQPGRAPERASISSSMAVNSTALERISIHQKNDDLLARR